MGPVLIAYFRINSDNRINDPFAFVATTNTCFYAIRI